MLSKRNLDVYKFLKMLFLPRKKKLRTLTCYLQYVAQAVVFVLFTFYMYEKWDDSMSKDMV